MIGERKSMMEGRKKMMEKEREYILRSWPLLLRHYSLALCLCSLSASVELSSLWGGNERGRERGKREGKRMREPKRRQNCIHSFQSITLWEGDRLSSTSKEGKEFKRNSTGFRLLSKLKEKRCARCERRNWGVKEELSLFFLPFLPSPSWYQIESGKNVPLFWCTWSWC